MNLATTQTKIQPSVKGQKLWKEMFEVALDDLSGLLSPKRIIFCEGKHEPKSGEEQGLDAVVFNNIFSAKYNDALFVSSGGNTELDQRSEIA
ncbi:MAG: hypothetical protein H7235_00860, partial [Bdellovibrionaceae bacterium]|nr:hypothetical protein [Pseudobdellovibrionaceae bacterium]